MRSHVKRQTAKLWFLAIFTVGVILTVYCLPPIAQPMSYHRFADSRSLLHIPNFWNVITNLPFAFIGAYGLAVLRKSADYSGIKLIYGLLFSGVLLTGIGSAYYHWHPDNNTLVWDRIPLTIVFMALLSVSVYELISPTFGFILLFPLALLGIFSVWWWHYSEIRGQGDLRLYAFVQFYPALIIPLFFWFFYAPELKPTIRCLIWILLWYALAKVFEHFDTNIFQFIGIGGHALKHIAAGVSTWYLVLLVKVRHIATNGAAFQPI